MGLTPKQEAFCQAIADGNSQAESYRIAFDCKPSIKPETVWSRASELMADGKVAARVNELKSALAEKALWSREDSVKILADIAKDEEASRKDKTAAIKVLNEMHGYNAPVKVEHSGGVRIVASDDDQAL